MKPWCLLVWLLLLPAAALAAPLTIYTREGCPRCAEAAEYLEARADEVEVVWRRVDVDPSAAAELRALAAARGVGPVGVPAFRVGEVLVIGWQGPATAARLDALLEGEGREFPPVAGETCGVEAPCPASESVELPVLGTVDARDLGLPLFTLALGLVDGFNPCAMWVLLFVLSLLAAQRDRGRMALVGGTFVVVSGAVYFVFMAAWLNAFLWVGLSRGVQVVLGLVALTAATIHVKDFFAFHRGVTLSIPESAKPGLYARARRVIQARSTLLALGGAAALAVVVNLVELLCTAGLPALFTQVLVARQLSTPAYYAYLGLYDLAYMFDDALMLTIAVVTLGRRKLQEREGRWLKLVSGLVMAALGLVLLLRPEWLSMGF
jgi:glutaredoxin